MYMNAGTCRNHRHQIPMNAGITGSFEPLEVSEGNLIWFSARGISALNH